MGINEDDMDRSRALDIGDKIEQAEISAVPLRGGVAMVSDVVRQAVTEEMKIAQPRQTGPQAAALPTSCTHANDGCVGKAAGKSLAQRCALGKLLA